MPESHTTLAYVFEAGGLRQHAGRAVRLVKFGEAIVRVNTDNSAVRFMLFAGEPFREPIAPRTVVMNTGEIQQALQDLRNGTFVKQL
jgi:redox-sensitive bicupin YhaK (pirin superfamily)